MGIAIAWPCVVFLCLGAGLPGAEAYLAGHNALLDKKYVEAAAQFSKAHDAGGALADFAQTEAWEAAWLQGDATAEKAAWTWVHQAPAGAARDFCAARLGVYLAHTERAAEASALLMPLVDIDPAPWWMDASMWDAGDALVKAGGDQAVAGYACFSKIVLRPGYVPQRNDAARRLKLSPDPAHRRAAAYALFRAGAFDDAEALITSTPLDLKNDAGAALDLAAFEAALANVKADPANEAPAIGVLNANKGNPWFPLLVARAVRASFKAQSTAGARGLALWSLATFPEDREAGDNVWFVAQGLASRDAATSLALYELLSTKAPGHGRATNAANEIVQYWLRQGDLKKSQDAAESLGSRFPDSRFRAENYYDLAQRWQAAGDDKASLRDLVFAVNSGPGEYFAHRALQALQERLPENARPMATPQNFKIDGGGAVLQPMPGLLAAEPALPPRVDEDPRIQRARFFGRYGMEEAEWQALALVRGLQGEDGDGDWYRALADAGVGFTAQQWADRRRWGYDGAARTLARWRFEFPRPYFDNYKQLGAQLGVDPYYLLSIARQESTFRASIVSKSGAVGVMQLMPGTAAWMAKTTPGVTVEMSARLASPVNSIVLGGNYIAQMLNKFGGNMLYAAGAYNAGPGNVTKWLKGSPGAAPDVFVDLIPLEETKGYVRKVLGNFAAYHSLYPAEPAKP